ncbi:hypothetical protein PFISCL1PPCAC_20480, partial [Pristionchus fissidentatus]
NREWNYTLEATTNIRRLISVLVYFRLDLLPVFFPFVDETSKRDWRCNILPISCTTLNKECNLKIRLGKEQIPLRLISEDCAPVGHSWWNEQPPKEIEELYKCYDDARNVRFEYDLYYMPRSTY